MRMLIAEDDLISRRLMEAMLSPFGECHTAVDGKEAIESFRMAYDEENPYDLLCLDIMMPEIDGQEALKRIRKIEKERGVTGSNEVKVIMTTALDDPKTVVEAFYKGGATAYIVKPVDKKKLIDELRAMGLIREP